MMVSCSRLRWAALLLPTLALGAARADSSDSDRGKCCCDRPKVTIRLGCAQASGVPDRDHHARTGGGSFVVRQPSPDTVVITMTGLAEAGCSVFSPSTASFNFDLSQSFTIVCESSDVKQAVLQVQGYALGVLRCPCKGSAALSSACGTITCAAPGTAAELASFCLPARIATSGQNESIYLRSERFCLPALPVCYTLHQRFAIVATQESCGSPGNGPAADFSTHKSERVNMGGERRDPFEGISRKDFGFHIVLKVSPVPSDGQAQKGSRQKGSGGQGSGGQGSGGQGTDDLMLHVPREQDRRLELP